MTDTESYTLSLWRDIILDHLSEGLALFDGDERLVLWNSRFVELMAFPENLVVRRIKASALLEFCARRGDLGSGSPDGLTKIGRTLFTKGDLDLDTWNVGNGTTVCVKTKSVTGNHTLATIQKNPDARSEDADRAEIRRKEYRRLLDESPQEILVHRQGVIIYANPALLENTGSTLEETGVLPRDVIGMGIEDFVAPEEEPIIAQRIKRGDIGVWEGRVRLADGSYRIFETANAEIDWTGGPARQITLIDMTRRREMEAALRESEASFRDLIEGSMQGVLIYRDDVIIYVNQSAADIHGGTCEMLHGQPVSTFFQPGSKAPVNLPEAGEAKSAQRIPAKRKDGSQIWVEVNARNILWEGKPAQQLTIADVTERHQAEEVLLHAQKMESLGQLTGGIAHDFNNLLGVISGNLELLRDQTGSDLHRDYIDTSLRAVRRGAELTQRLLAFARKQPLRPKPTNINNLIMTMQPMLERTLGEAITIDTVLAPEPWSANVDQGQLENALLNLALNARDAMPAGGLLSLETENIRVEEDRIEGTSVTKAGDYLRLVVRDDGIGMASDVKANAFEPFFTTKQAGIGSGLGLSMVYGFVRQSSGSVQIESSPGAGTAVILLLPRTETGAVGAGADKPQVASANGAGHVVLVVEDDTDLRQLAIVLLRQMGFQVYEAGDGREALALLSKLDRLDLLFTDLVLPRGLGGMDIAREGRNLFPGMKVLFTSGYSDQISPSVTMPGSNMRMILKPYRRDSLMTQVAEILAL